MRESKLVFFVAAIAAVGCGHATLPVSGNFVELDSSYSSYVQRLTTANGVVLGVRDTDNDPQGSAEFWLQAIRNRLTQAGGYALTDEQDITIASGQTGTLLRFGRDEGTTPHVYWLALVVTENRIVVVEAGGRRDQFEGMESEVESIITQLEL